MRGVRGSEKRGRGKEKGELSVRWVCYNSKREA